MLIIKNQRLLMQMVSQGLRVRTVGSIFGFVWLILYPLLFLGLYALVFIYIFHVQPIESSLELYILSIFSGLIPFLAVSEALNSGSQSIIANRGLLKNTLVPIELVVAKDVIVSHITMVFAMVLLCIACLFFHQFQSTFMFIPLVFFLQIIMMLGIVWLMSACVVFFRDIQQTLPLLTLFLMMMSPIAYQTSMVPASFRPFLKLNPLVPLIGLYRSCLFEGYFSFLALLEFAGLSFCLFFLGYTVITKLKPLFIDYV